jgi:hypothetical protein
MWQIRNSSLGFFFGGFEWAALHWFGYLETSANG